VPPELALKEGHVSLYWEIPGAIFPMMDAYLWLDSKDSLALLVWLQLFRL
jgi:hypothetical protein